ncbi:MAG: hypothetical protein O7G31_16950 [Calditrichaeota bacterium]|nr:hypothetical protein [Calditrichota bacterium]
MAKGCKVLQVMLIVGLVVSGLAKERHKEKIEKTIAFSSASDEKELIVDNIRGSIVVEGYDGDKVQMVVHKSISARNERKMQRAKEEVILDIEEKDNQVILYVDAPYREPNGSINYRGYRHYGYEVTHDFELKVPFKTNIWIKTINDGEISVKNVDGLFDLENINGGIEAFGLSGSGRVYALNGAVRVEFKKNPEKRCYFGSLNGEIEVTFLPGLQADMRFKTFNGEVYSDFPVTYLQPRAPIKKRRGAKFVYKADKSFGARVGEGGPELEFDGFNGDIYVVKK